MGEDLVRGVLTWGTGTRVRDFGFDFFLAIGFFTFLGLTVLDMVLIGFLGLTGLFLAACCFAGTAFCWFHKQEPHHSFFL
jgi:uncharacterized membrane protein YbhN (UPF0104 family)